MMKTMTCCGTFMMRTGDEFQCIFCNKTASAAEEPAYSEAKVNETPSGVNTGRNLESPQKPPRVLCIIPSRLESTRLPGKVLLSKTGKPLIQYAWEAARSATLVDEVIVASDSAAILDACRAFGARVLRTGPRETGTDRVAAVVEAMRTEAEIIVNLQADEPEITGEDIDQLVGSMLARPHVDLATMVWETRDRQIAYVGHHVKVVASQAGRAIYFSRAGIPFQGNGTHAGFQEGPWKIHAGIYAYRREFLLRFAAAPRSPLEIAENLEQLRALEMGAYIHLELLSHLTRGIDTPGDYAEFVAGRNVVSAVE